MLMLISLGPQHPSTHGVLRIGALIIGDHISNVNCNIGLLHRGTEVFSYNNEYNKSIPYLARTDYVSYLSGLSIIMAVTNIIIEHELITSYTRIYILNGINKILNYLLLIGCHLLDHGLTNIFIACFKLEREYLQL